MNPVFYIQSGYTGKEVGALMNCYDRARLSFSAVNEYQDGQIPVGTVEFVESFIGPRRPNYYPEFLKSYFKRGVWESPFLPFKASFIKPADRHKRFDAMAIPSKLTIVVDKDNKIITGPFSCSEIIKKPTEEWRYYVANGEILAAYWYQGEEKEIEPPELNVAFPSSFCGAVDFGRSDGEVVLIENNLPYACGWYGPYSEGDIYGKWLEKGFSFLTLNK